MTSHHRLTCMRKGITSCVIPIFSAKVVSLVSWGIFKHQKEKRGKSKETTPKSEILLNLKQNQTRWGLTGISSEREKTPVLGMRCCGSLCKLRSFHLDSRRKGRFPGFQVFWLGHLEWKGLSFDVWVSCSFSQPYSSYSGAEIVTKGIRQTQRGAWACQCSAATVSILTNQVVLIEREVGWGGEIFFL